MSSDLHKSIFNNASVNASTPIEQELAEFGMTKKEYNRLKYGWSKYGDPNFGLVQRNLTEEWACQSCSEAQDNHLPSFMFEFMEREFIRICSKCQNLKIKNNVSTFDKLIELCRHHAS